MCGRYVARKLRWADYAAQPHFEEFSETKLAARFNIAPSQQVPVVRLDKNGDRVGDLVRWGLIPSWAKGKPKQQLINARAETIVTSPMFWQAFVRRRCLQLADGFYEWRMEDGVKQPYFLRLASAAAFAFAGIWERWKGEQDAQPIDTCCHITTTPNAIVRPIHDRMPVILHPEDYPAWLDSKTDSVTLQSLLKPPPDGELVAYPVSRSVIALLGEQD